MLMMRTVFKIMKVITSFMPVLLLPSFSVSVYTYLQHQPHTFILQTSLNHEMCLGWNVNRPESDRKGKGGEFLIQQNAWVDHKVAFMCAYIESKVKVVSEQYFYTTLFISSLWRVMPFTISLLRAFCIIFAIYCLMWWFHHFT